MVDDSEQLTPKPKPEETLKACGAENALGMMPRNLNMQGIRQYTKHCPNRRTPAKTDSAVFTRPNHRTHAKPICPFCGKPVDPLYCHVECREKRLASTTLADGDADMCWDCTHEDCGDCVSGSEFKRVDFSSAPADEKIIPLNQKPCSFCGKPGCFANCVVDGADEGERFVRTDNAGNKFRCAEGETVTMSLASFNKMEAALAEKEKTLKSCDDARVNATKLLCEAETCKRGLQKRIENLVAQLELFHLDGGA